MYTKKEDLKIKGTSKQDKTEEANPKQLHAYFADELKKIRPSGYRGTGPLTVKTDNKQKTVQPSQFVDDRSADTAMKLAMDKYFAKAVTAKIKKYSR